MTRRTKFAIIYAPEVRRHVGAIPLKHHRLIRQSIEEQLTFTPGAATRNRKPLEETPGPFGSTWELRCGGQNQFRVFYEWNAESCVVSVLAIGVKARDQLFIAGEEFVL